MTTNVIKSFKLDAINDNEMRKFSCWGSVEVKDRHGEVIPADEVYKVMDIWMDRGAPIMFNHTNRNVGRGLNWQPLEKNGKPGVLITGTIHKHYAEDDEVWNGIKKGDFEGLSIGGKSYTRDTQEDGTTFLRDLIGYEFSIVERCGNQEATFTEVNQMAKSEQIKKEDPVMDETPEEESKEDDMMTQLQETLAQLVERVNAIEESVSGAPQAEEAVEENKEEEEPSEEEKEEEEEPSEEEKEEDEENMEKSEEESEEEGESPESEEVQKELKKLKKEIKELKKSAVKKVIKTERPAEVSKKTSKHDEIRKSLHEMSQSGKIDFKGIGKELRGIEQ